MLNSLIFDFLKDKGACDIGFCKLKSPFKNLDYAISFCIRLSDAVVDEIGSSPTYTYFHHYRTVNSFIDRLGLETVILLQDMGYNAVANPASQSHGDKDYAGLFSHKTAAVKSGLGSIGKSGLFISKKYGPRVRLGTVFTDAPLEVSDFSYEDVCGGCDLCVKACPAGAITGKTFYLGIDRREIFDPQKCSDYMKKHFHHIGRGAVCGICMRVCPKGQRQPKI